MYIKPKGKENRFVNCCDKDKSIQFSLNKNIRSCKPIFIPNEDKFFKKDQFDCMNYVRSRPAVRSDCTFGPMEQVTDILNNNILINLYYIFIIIIKIITLAEAILNERL